MALLEISHVEVSYGSRPILQDVSLTAEVGELVVLLGPSGSGKSTLLHVMTGLLAAKKGEVKWEGKSLTKHQATLVRNEKIGVMFQSDHLCPYYTIRENIALGYSDEWIDEERANQLEMVPLLERMPPQLSGGERSRAALLRAMQGNPQFLCCDEPTGNLDELHAHQVLEVLRTYARDHLVILSTHDERLAQQYATAMYRLKQGTLVCERRDLPQFEAEAELPAREGRTYSWSQSRRGARAAWKGHKGIFWACIVAFSFSFLGLGMLLGLQPGISNVMIAQREQWLDNRVITLDYRHQGQSETIPSSLMRHIEQAKAVGERQVNFDYVLNQVLPSLMPAWNPATWVGISFDELALTPQRLEQGVVPTQRLHILANRAYQELVAPRSPLVSLDLSGVLGLTYDQQVEWVPCQFELAIDGIINDGGWYQTPKWYVDQEAWQAAFREVKLAAMSDYYGVEQLSLLDYFWDESIGDDVVPLQYRYPSLEETERAYQSMLRLPTATSTPWSTELPPTHQLYVDVRDGIFLQMVPNLLEQITKAMEGFLGLLLAGTCSLALLCFDYGFQKRRRERALLQAFGVTKQGIRKLYFGELALFFRWTLIGSLGSYLGLSLLIYGMSSLLFSLLLPTVLLPLSVLPLAGMVGAILLFFGGASVGPYLRGTHQSVLQQLRDDA